MTDRPLNSDNEREMRFDEGEDASRGSHLISVDELRAAGALDVPAAWRKSLGGERELPLFSGLVDEDDTAAEKQPSRQPYPDSDESADETP